MMFLSGEGVLDNENLMLMLFIKLFTILIVMIVYKVHSNKVKKAELETFEF